MGPFLAPTGEQLSKILEKARMKEFGLKSIGSTPKSISLNLTFFRKNGQFHSISAIDRMLTPLIPSHDILWGMDRSELVMSDHEDIIESTSVIGQH